MMLGTEIVFVCKYVSICAAVLQSWLIWDRPIATYKRQACTKHGVKPSQHGIIHTHDREPMLLNAEPELGVSPIRLVVSRKLQGFEKLAPESRINYSKHVTIEHNAPVFIIGRIHHEDRDILGAGVDKVWQIRVENRQRKKDRKKARGKEHTPSRSHESNHESSRSVEASMKLPERHAPNNLGQEGHQPDHSHVKHSGSTYQPQSSSSPDYRPDEAAKDGDYSSHSSTVGRILAGKHGERQESHVSSDSHLAVSDTQVFQERFDSSLDSPTISNTVIHDQGLHSEGAEAYDTGNSTLLNSQQSPGSSICLTETPSDTPATGSHLTASQRRQILVQSLIAYVTSLLQTKTESRGDNVRVHTESSGNPPRGNAISSEADNQATESSFGSGQPIAPNRKKRHRQQSSEEGSDEENRSPSRESKGKQNEPQAPFACPYVKRYGSQASCNISSNGNKGWPNSARVK
jgi:hypothetical protein